MSTASYVERRNACMSNQKSFLHLYREVYNFFFKHTFFFFFSKQLLFSPLFLEIGVQRKICFLSRVPEGK